MSDLDVLAVVYATVMAVLFSAFSMELCRLAESPSKLPPMSTALRWAIVVTPALLGLLGLLCTLYSVLK